MTTKEFLLDQFSYTYDTDGWFVALKNTFKHLAAEQAAWKPDGVENSIWGIVRHLNFYNERFLRKFKDEKVEDLKIENSETFAGADGASEENWQAEIERFDRVMNDWREAFEAADESKFEEIYDEESQTNWAQVVGLMNAHHAHHGGQIILLRKLQGSWDSSKGVS